MSTLSREEVARQEIGRTEVRPLTAWLLTGAFLTTLVGVPTMQLAHELQQTSPDGAVLPGCCRVLACLPRAAACFESAGGSLVERVNAANASLLDGLVEYEQALEDDSLLTARILPPTQHVLAAWGGAGNEQAYLGRDGWLFYRPGFDYVTGRAFLDEATLRKRRSSGGQDSPAPQPDSRPAIIDFHRELAARGIRLVLLPAPVKPMLEPERLSSRYHGCRELLQNASYEQWKRDIEAAGVLVFDPAPLLLEQKLQTGEPQFLRTDTHWTPSAVERVARELKELLTDLDILPQTASPGYRSESVEVANLGDIAVMLKLPDGQKLYSAEQVQLERIADASGALWRPVEESDVLLLGDSFTNIYSLPGMNWGEAAGLAEQLSFALQRPLDRIAQNDAGAFATRQALALDLARGRDRLAGKRVVIWEFAIRELAVGDWKRIPLPQRASPRQPTPPSEETESLAEGTVIATTAIPAPGSVPYRDAVTSIHLADLTGGASRREIGEAVVYCWGMRDNRLTAAARLHAGRKLKLKLTPWHEVQSQYSRYTRVELDDPEFALIDLPTFWAEILP
jgi:hypothetical protein